MALDVYTRVQKRIYSLIRPYRWRKVRGLLDDRSKTVLDVGSGDLFVKDSLSGAYDVTPVDISPLVKGVQRCDAANLGFRDKSFDIVLCLQVLEHVPDPVSAIKELRRVARRQVIISVPNEPFFSLFRLLSWDPEHLWAISPKALKHHLGEPRKEERIIFSRYYLGSWYADDTKG